MLPCVKLGGLIQIADLTHDGTTGDIGFIDLGLWSGGIGSALEKETFVSLLKPCGFRSIQVHRTGYRIHPSTASICIQGKRG